MAKQHPVFSRKLRMGMIGGGPGAFIGDVHRKAARLDGQIEIVAGAFDINPAKSRAMGKQLYLPKERAYGTYQDMIKGELALPEGERVDFVTITTPNSSHFPIAKAFLEAGFHVYCEKPMTMDVAQAKALVKIVKKTGKVFGLNHNYTGYPMGKLARDLVQGGELGKVRKVDVQYPQGWLATKVNNMQANWRCDPKQAGAGGCLGDIGSHADNLAEYITGLRITEVCAELTSFVPGRLLDDDCNALLRFNNGAKGVLRTSQISVGHQNDIAIWVYCEKGTIEWHQEDPNELYVYRLGKPVETWRRGEDYVAAKSAAAVRATRLPSGHPEAFFEALANLYANYTETVRANIAGKKPSKLALDFPTVEDGLRGMQFIETCVKSKGKWVKIPK